MKFACIHGHFYQPPRENPWTGRIDRQPTAAPWPDWNHRITAECYRPSGRAKLLGEDGDVRRRLSTWEHISFDVGPTLSSWLERHAPDVHETIVRADRASAARLGHGNAIAQGCHHAILPLASEADKEREVERGIEDFVARFGRDPEGLWLPETAVDTATLVALAAAGIGFTILAPGQCREMRSAGGEWGPLVPGMPARVALPGGRDIVVFFYDGPVSQGVAFEGLLHDGEDYANHLMQAPGFAMAATDGESYGHHHRHGEMALARCIEVLEGRDDVALSNPAAWMAANEVRHEALLVLPSSWSCAHGVGRWSRDCGCALAGPANGRWRGELRAALNALRDDLGEVDGALLDCRLKMFTSCGWFFDAPGIEAIQILRYALRAIELSGREDLEEPFVERLGSLGSLWRDEVRSILPG